MKILENYNLKKLNTFGVSCVADFFVEINSENDLKELFISPIFQGPNLTSPYKNIQKLFLGCGSNILFTKDFKGLVILNKLKGIEIIKEDLDFVWIKAQSGELWHDLVNFSVDRGYWGLENLSLIPGSVGAAPVQNIGAYGVELKDVLESVEVFVIKNSGDIGTKRIFLNQECEFSYRDSIFKNKLKDEYFISSIILKLNKERNTLKPTNYINLNYKILQDYIKKNNLIVKSSKDVSLAVSSIRKSKLPDPVIIGNAGSFFKNVILHEADLEVEPPSGPSLGGSATKLESLLKIDPEMPYFIEKDCDKESPCHNKIKIPAAWLIEKTGWKGYRKGNVGVHKDHALVLVNYGGATGSEIKNLSDQIIKSVFEKFNIILEPEVNIL
jgi:UDP-N-acetylmuramate dehydrogenase